MRNKGRRFRKVKNKLKRKMLVLRGKPSRSPHHNNVVMTATERKKRKWLKKMKNIENVLESIDDS